jgi:Protein of unknown function (DUF2585)
MPSSERLNNWRDAVMRWSERTPIGIYLVIAAGFVALQAVVLFALGQPPICTCGTIRLWSAAVSGPENSQQLTDWYTYTHIVHGVGFYFLLWLIAPRLPIGLRFALAVGLEAGWEIIENTPFIIDRYRQSALAQGYFGDSVVNSVVDTLAGAFGFFLARLLPVWSSIALIVAMELFVGSMIHDNLTLNIIQLIHPSQAISHWQTGG